ncbi:hypothetical protein AV530_009231 [Patagioenas fasciata monilis]|uniref:RING-type E3 ubiquitin transferase n=1 Tax=Patagioenas fasciata monilis TaxID=372326 RepID=A0A1V4KMI7_PATFA|nr:hypothetical protein AV530_009231 [Patagioenas fasciata monilis]
MAEAAAVSQHRFFCHSCKGQVSPKLPEYTCPRCESGFIEEVTDDASFLEGGADDSASTQYGGQRAAAAPRPCSYHAFISYSRADAAWVRRELLRRLESVAPPYRLCIHERDFTPGRWIIENIVENIERSAKVVFVLSRSFVDSEWCNYELYFAQQRAVGLGAADVILVLKEPVEVRGLPRRFARLRKMLGTKTYLEWPREASRRPFFWLQLRSLLGTPGELGGGGEGDTAAGVTT